MLFLRLGNHAEQLLNLTKPLELFMIKLQTQGYFFISSKMKLEKLGKFLLLSPCTAFNSVYKLHIAYGIAVKQIALLTQDQFRKWGFVVKKHLRKLSLIC